jgi:hydroxyacyl-ACP dehydratase HTD2-like protein with hotdog domain
MSNLIRRPFLIKLHWSNRRFVSDLSSRGPWTIVDFMSPTQSEYLDASLQAYLPIQRHKRLIGEKVNPGYHLVYFNPQNPESTLSADGYESHQSPGPRFCNRMWVGGSVEYNLKTSLKLGLPSVAVESIQDVKHIVKPDLDERITVTIDRKLKNKEDNHDWAIRELRSLMYFTKFGGGNREKMFRRDLTRK